MSSTRLMDMTLAQTAVPFERDDEGLLLRWAGTRAPEVIVRVRELSGDVVSMEAVLPALPGGRKESQALLCLNRLTGTSGYVKSLLRDGGPALAVELGSGLCTPELVAGFARGLAALADLGSKDLADSDLWAERQDTWGDVIEAHVPTLDVSTTKKLVKKTLQMAGAPVEGEVEYGMYAELDIAGGMRVFVSVGNHQVGFAISPRLVWQLGKKKELKDSTYLTRLLRGNAEVAVARVGIDLDSVERYLYQ